MLRLHSPVEGTAAFRVTAVLLEVVLAVGALGGGLALVLGPHGEILPLPVSQLHGSPFDSYFVPGLILFTILGIGPLLVAFLAWRRQRWAPLLTIGVGVTLLAWLTIEIVIVGYSNEPPLQPIYLVMAAVIGLIGLGWARRSGSPFKASRPTTSRLRMPMTARPDGSNAYCCHSCRSWIR